jgi:hypothetical protein
MATPGLGFGCPVSGFRSLKPEHLQPFGQERGLAVRFVASRGQGSTLYLGPAFTTVGGLVTALRSHRNRDLQAYKIYPIEHASGLADTGDAMVARTDNRKRAVLDTMPTIRWLLARHGFQMERFSDDTIADALIDTCPTPDDFWLRSEHLNLAVRHISAAPAPNRPAEPTPGAMAVPRRGRAARVTAGQQRR